MSEVFFDFDGVLVDSNEIKFTAFCLVAKKFFGQEVASGLELKLRSNSANTRFQIFDDLLRNYEPIMMSCSRQVLLDEFESIAREGISKAERLSYGHLVQCSNKFRTWILSAAPTDVVSKLVEEFDWQAIFEERVMGSPITKLQHLDSLNELDWENSFFLGDSRSDLEVAQKKGLQFVFIYGWSKWKPTPEEHNSIFRSFPTTEQAIVFLCDLSS